MLAVFSPCVRGFVIKETRSPVKIPVVLLTLSALLLGGCATVRSTRDIVAESGRVALVTNFSPTMRMQNVGTTVFNNKAWDAETGFDADAEALAVAQPALTKKIKAANGHELGLPPPSWLNGTDPSLPDRLTALGREWQADIILVLTSGNTQDWLYGTNQRIEGIGLYRREVFGMKRYQVYGVFALRAFDCRTGKFTGFDMEKDARTVPDLQWHETWAEFSAHEKRNTVHAWHELFKETIPQLLTKAGLANAPKPERHARFEAKMLLVRPDFAKSWVPDGNELDLPEGITRAQAHLAVLNGLKARRWTVVSDAEDRVVGVYRDGKKEAGVTATITDKSITLMANDHEVKPDGQRIPASYDRWQRNLKESIYRDLLKAEPEPVTK